jgi:glycosyltransferase involved in cell wall biosynthesis
MKVKIRKNNGVAISVALATRNRAPSLARLLDGLAGQVYAPCFEVIVADNGSSDETLAVVEQAGKKLTVRYVREKRPGKGRALNAALLVARGELIVFTDDDVQPFPDWLFQMHKAAQDYPECNVFGGRIEVDIQTVPYWISRSFNLMGILTSYHDKGDADMLYGYSQYPFGPNMAVRRQYVINNDKPYPETLGPGTTIPVGDEPTFLFKISPPGASDRMYVAKACVRHEIERENVFFFNALKRCCHAGFAHGRLGFFHVASHGCSGNTSVISLISRRLGSCRSVREFVCITSRYFFFLYGRHFSNAKFNEHVITRKNKIG